MPVTCQRAHKAARQETVRTTKFQANIGFVWRDELLPILCWLDRGVLLWGISSNGRASALHAEGSGIDARILQFFRDLHFSRTWLIPSARYFTLNPLGFTITWSLYNYYETPPFQYTFFHVPWDFEKAEFDHISFISPWARAPFTLCTIWVKKKCIQPTFAKWRSFDVPLTQPGTQPRSQGHRGSRTRGGPWNEVLSKPVAEKMAVRKALRKVTTNDASSKFWLPYPIVWFKTHVEQLSLTLKL